MVEQETSWCLVQKWPGAALDPSCLTVSTRRLVQPCVLHRCAAAQALGTSAPSFEDTKGAALLV